MMGDTLPPEIPAPVPPPPAPPVPPVLKKSIRPKKRKKKSSSTGAGPKRKKKKTIKPKVKKEEPDFPGGLGDVEDRKEPLKTDRTGALKIEKDIDDLPEPPVTPKVQNVVSTFHVGVQLDLKKVMTCSRNSEYNPKRFAAVIMRIQVPKSTALVFKSGKIVVTGARSEKQSLLAARKYARILQRIGFKAQFRDFKIQNVVSSVDVRFAIRLEGLVFEKTGAEPGNLTGPMNPCTSYEPEIFPGLIYRMKKPKVVLLIFVSGKVVLTGGKCAKDVNRAFKIVYPHLVNCAQTITPRGFVNPPPWMTGNGDTENPNLK